MKDGYAVEAVVKELVASWPDRDTCQFQKTYVSPGNLVARTDLVKQLEDGQIDIFEIKGSTSLKSSTGQDHVNDAAFQTLAIERSGQVVRSINIIHVNKEFVRNGNIDPTDFLVIVDVTDEIRKRLPDIEGQVDEALAFLDQTEIDESSCSCLYVGSRPNQCASFDYFNQGVPDHSIYLLPRISKSKVQTFVDEKRLSLNEIDVSEVSKLQVPVLIAAQQGTPIVNKVKISDFIESLTWPLHFLDYETFASAIPLADGLKPHLPMPVQYSLHALSTAGELRHFEHLSDRPGQQLKLVEQMKQDFVEDGSVLCWNKSFEMSCNRRMADLFPDESDFLTNLNDRTVDLMEVFKEDYVDVRFEGSVSIKKVLPVVCPHLKYDQDAVHDGTGAM
ncbi:DUF2779 domain-containing protein [Sneathiella sp.]|uniref:DUF2779 domain-containing protein n=1 Tax=Sneathiella sp. TaxID=1964365 RepID=UPI003569B5D7